MTPSSDKQQSWYREGLCFSCQQCGNCCSGSPGYVWVTLEELAEIACYMEKNSLGKELAVKRVGTRFSLGEKNNGDCVFLDRLENGKAICKIHPVKPKQCQQWPFWNAILTSKKEWQRQSESCPGMNQGKLYSWEEIEETRQQSP